MADLDQAVAALVDSPRGIMWVVVGKNAWDEILSEHPSYPVMTAREVRDMRDATDAEWSALLAIKRVMPGARMTERKGQEGGWES